MAGTVSAAGFESLRIGTDAQTAALGMAGVAAASGPAACFFNPAGLPGWSENTASATLHRWIQDVTAGVFGVAWSGKSRGFGIAVQYTESGGIEHRIVPSPEPIGTFSWNELSAGISFGVRRGKWSFGLTGKVLYEKIFIDDAWGGAADFGAAVETGFRGLRLAGAVTNLGATGRLQREPVDLPTAVRIGAYLPVGLSEGLHGSVVLDALVERGGSFHLLGGAALALRRVLFVRAGYQGGYDNRGFCFGAGIALKSYRLDYAFLPLGSGLGESHRFTFGVRW